MRKQKGITLISLLITIIILIILAGIGINLSLGENGLFNKAKQAKQYYQTKANEEETLLSNASNEIDRYIDSREKVNHEMKIDKLITYPEGIGSIKQSIVELILDVRDYKKLMFGTLNMSSENYNRMYISKGKSLKGDIAVMMNERSGESGIFENMEWDVSQCDYIHIHIQSGRGDTVYIENITLK